MTKIQLQLAKTYEENGYNDTLSFWTTHQDEIALLDEKERASLKSMMRRYCLINGDMGAAAKVMEENLSLKNNEIMPLLLEFGQVNYLGKSTVKNDSKSEKIYSLVFEYGSSEDLFHLGEMYKSGNGAKTNLEKAVECFYKSAILGNKLAQFSLGEMYMRGLGVDKNMQKAEKWYISATTEKSTSTTYLYQMIIPDGIEYIEAYAFQGIETLRSVIIPNSIKRICDGAFKDCHNLTNVQLMNTAISLGFKVFEGTSLTEYSKQQINKTNFVFVKGNSKIQDFYIGRFLVTQDLYEEIIGKNPSYFKGARYPVDSISWHEAVAFCNALSEREDLMPCYSKRGGEIICNFKANGYRLPTTIEWKYAANGGINNDAFKYAGSDNIEEVAWYKKNSGGKTHSVGEKKANSLGIFDMSGNVSEWATDSYVNKSYYSSYVDGKCNYGGSYADVDSDCKVARCNGKNESTRYRTIGFRIVRNAD